MHDSDLARVWPARYEHLNVYGRFHFDVETAQRRKGLRPLRGASGRIPCRVESWRGEDRDGELLFAGGFRHCPVPQSVPWTRFQLPPHRTQHADFPHYALLFASCQGLWDLSSWERFQPQLLGTRHAVMPIQAQRVM